jgi:hypothetical protein
MFRPRLIRFVLAANIAGLSCALLTQSERANEQPGYAPASDRRRL